MKGVLSGTAALVLMAGSAEAQSYTAWCSTDGSELNIRARNWVGSEVISYLCNGWDIEVAGVTSNGWAKVCGGGFSDWDYGYCKIEYLTCKPDGAGTWRNSTNGRVRIRKDMGGKTSGWLKAGDSIRVISWAKDDDGNEWAYTKKGWVNGDCLTKER